MVKRHSLSGLRKAASTALWIVLWIALSISQWIPLWIVLWIAMWIALKILLWIALWIPMWILRDYEFLFQFIIFTSVAKVYKIKQRNVLPTVICSSMY